MREAGALERGNGSAGNVLPVLARAFSQVYSQGATVGGLCGGERYNELALCGVICHFC